MGVAEGVNKFARELARHESGVTTEEGFARGRARHLYNAVLSLYFNEFLRELKPSPFFDDVNFAEEQKQKTLEAAGHSLHLLEIKTSLELNDVMKKEPSFFNTWISPVQPDGDIESGFLDFVDQSLACYQERHGTQEEKFASRMKPMIQLVNEFVVQYGRCPEFAEFRELDEQTRHSFKIEFGKENIKKLGGTTEEDFILGLWVGEWYHCYRSCDQEFYKSNKSDLSPN